MSIVLPPQVEFEHTRPHVTLTIFRSKDPLSTAQKVVDRLDALASMLPTAPTHPYNDNRHIVPLARVSDAGITSWGAWYRLEKRPTWLREDNSAQTGTAGAQQKLVTTDILDVSNHLIVLMVYQSFLGLYASHDTMRARLTELLEVGEVGTDQHIVKIDQPADVVTRDEIELAFVRGNTKSAWLEGLHVPTVLKADRKILSGPDLRYALDQFGEQTFTYTAAISEFGQRISSKPKTGGKPDRYRVGVSHAKKTLWTRSTRDYSEFVAEFKELIALLTNPTPIPSGVSELEKAGVPFVARPIATQTLHALSDGFDIGYETSTTPELELLTGEITEAAPKLDAWSRHGRFVVEGAPRQPAAPASEISAIAYFDDRKIATVSFRPVRRTDQTVDISHRVDAYHVRKDDEDLVALDRSLAKRDTNLTLRYGSGHVIQNGVLYTLQFRDVIFDRWRWTVLPPTPSGQQYLLKDEKPTTGTGKNKVFDPTQIGLAQSLFCFAKNNVSDIISPDGKPSNDWWLLCDDGAGEIADFIALDTKALFVTFIHVKAWKDGSKSTISVTPFSEVVAQAIKNLRSFDQNLLAKEINQRTTDRNKALVWRANGAPIDRKAFASKLDEFRPGAQRHVLILQPRIHRAAWGKAVLAHRAGKEGAEIGRMRQLSALLSGAESMFQRLAATVHVLGVDDQPATVASGASSSPSRALKPSRSKKRRP